MLFEAGGAGGLGLAHAAHAAIAHGLGGFAKTQRGGGEDGNACLLRRVENLDRVHQGARDGFVDEDRFVGFEAGKELFEVRTTIIRFEEDHVHLVEQGINAGYDLHAELFHLLDVFRHAFRARFDVLRALRIGRHDAQAHDLWLLRVGVAGFGEGDGVGGIEADDASADILGGGSGGESGEGEERAEDHARETTPPGGSPRRGVQPSFRKALPRNTLNTRNEGDLQPCGNWLRGSSLIVFPCVPCLQWFFPSRISGFNFQKP